MLRAAAAIAKSCMTAFQVNVKIIEHCIILPVDCLRTLKYFRSVMASAMRRSVVKGTVAVEFAPKLWRALSKKRKFLYLHTYQLLRS